MSNLNGSHMTKAEGRKKLAQAKGALFAPAGLGKTIQTNNQALKVRKIMR